MENTTEFKQTPARKSFNGIQYSTKGDSTLIILDRAKNYFIAYSMDRGGRNQHLLYQFEFDDEAENPFMLPQPTIIDGKPSGENSAIDIITNSFNSCRIGIHLLSSVIGKSERALRLYFFGLVIKHPPIRNPIIIKAGTNVFEAHLFQTGDALCLEFTADGIVLSRPGHEYVLGLERGIEWAANEMK